MRLRNFPYASNPFMAGALAILVVLLAVKIFDISYPVSLTTRTVSGELSVVGEGKVDVVPDTANVSVGIVVADAKTVQETEAKINEVNNKIVAALKNLGIDEKDIETTNYSINPNYNYEGGKNNITGYYGSATLTVKVRDTKTLPKVITAATKAGANQVYNTGFSVEDPAKYREQARQLAIQNAKEQAQRLAGQLGIKLGKIVNIVEATPEGIVPPVFRETQGLGGAVLPSLEAGTQTIRSVVTLYFEKK